MSWDNVLLEQLSAGAELAPAIERLFSIQRKRWATFREGEAALSAIRTKTLTLHGARVVLQANPGRRKSIHAKTDPESIATRRCFLCPENMPAEERGIAFGKFVILPNPYPVLRSHCTIPDRAHRRQRLHGQLGPMLELARELGSEMLVFYNGPRCGASAPDHLHFQACAASGVPILAELPISGSASVTAGHTSFGRRMLVFADRETDRVVQSIERTLQLMRALAESDEEPMLNLLACYREGRYVCILFPRAAHRPKCYAAAEPDRLAVSPGALEMAGILVVAEPDHFDRVDADVARRIYAEVSLNPNYFARLERELS